MTDPAGNDRLETGVPAGDAAGDGGDLGASTEDVPLTREDAVAHDTETDAREVEP